MHRDAFALMAAAEHGHWWFRGRREFIAAACDQLALPPTARILDAGCGSGGNLPLLARYGQLWGFECDAEARASATALGIGTIAAGTLPGAVPFDGTTFDAIGLFDVLEHLEFPVQSLQALAARLTPMGALVITVPALPWLRGPHDEHHQHYRRYTAATLHAHLAAAGLQARYLSYFNTLLLPLAVLQRMRERVTGYNVEQLIPGATVSTLLQRLWSVEKLWIPRLRAPVGLSLLTIAVPTGSCVA